MRFRGRKWNVSSNDRYLVHDLKEADDEGASSFDVKDTISSLLIDVTYTFSVSEHGNYAEIYVGHSGITLALFELSTQWCLTTPSGDGKDVIIGDTKPGMITFPDWKKHFDDHLTLKHFSKRRFTFLEGYAAFYVFRALITDGNEGIQELDRIGHEKVATAPEGECELLYGRAGYLQGLLFLRKRLNRPELFHDLVMLLIRQIIRVGLNGETLLWHWHGTPYLGAVHGIAGIFYVLLSCENELLQCYYNAFLLIGTTVDLVMERYAHHTDHTCNVFSSAKPEDSNRLVHFCHGATGWIPLLLKMSMRWKGEQAIRYLQWAKHCGETVWERGILVTKGPGLCHGLGGSICALVDLYTATGDALWLRRARLFSVCLVQMVATLTPLADRPLSLFEGKGGALYALAIVQALSDQEAIGVATGTPQLHGSHHPRMRQGDGMDWSSCFPGLGI